MAQNVIPKRSEVTEEFTWNLKDMFESDEAWFAEYEALKEMPARIAAFQGKLGESAETLLESFRLDDEISTRLSRLYGYASCKGDQDTGDNYYQDMRGKAMSTYVAIASAAAYRTSEIMAIPEDTLNLFYTVQPELETYRRSLYQIRRRAAHILSPKEETLLAAAGEMADSPESIGSVFRNAELRFPEVEDKDGVKHQLTNGSFVPLLESSDRVLRRNAFETYYNRLGEYKNTIAATLDAQFKQLRFFAGARKYETTLDSMFTLAHEMGHALHSYHSTKYQPTCTNDYVIFVAEVASTCNEVLLMRYLLGKTTDKKERAYLINHFMDQFKGTVYRQTMFAEFELEMGRMSERGEALTADALCAKYHELNKLYFGPDMISDDGIALEWARIPHFFYNYYVFQYATGFSAAVAIANRILAEGAPAVADYKKFLSGGSSTDPISLLKIAGVDMSSPAPVNSALQLFGELVDEMEALVD